MELSTKVDCSQNPKSYLLSIALRIWKNKKRKFAWRKRIAGTKQLIEEKEEPEEPACEKTLEEEVISREEKELVHRAVKKLPEKYQIPVLHYYMQG